MKNTHLICSFCKKAFNKPTKEFTRQIKNNPNRKFYCSLSCHGSVSTSHFQEWRKSEKNKKHLLSIGKDAAKVFDEADKPFSEYVRRCRYRKKLHISRGNLNSDEINYVDIEYLKTLWEDQNGRCALSNIPLIHGGDSLNTKASLDRKDSSKGYVKGNVQFVSCSINYAKNTKDDASIHELISLIMTHSINFCPSI